MKRILGLLGVTAVIACLPATGASAYVDPTASVDSVQAEGNRDANWFAIDVYRELGFGDRGANGWLHLTAVDSNGVHEWWASPVCMHVDPLGRDATILARINAATGEPATLDAVLLHVTDPEPDPGQLARIDFTNLNVNQYNRQFASGCATTLTARAAISGGHIIIVRRPE
jgi:hypothetical protein